MVEIMMLNEELLGLLRCYRWLAGVNLDVVNVNTGCFRNILVELNDPEWETRKKEIEYKKNLLVIHLIYQK